MGIHLAIFAIQYIIYIAEVLLFVSIAYLLQDHIMEQLCVMCRTAKMRTTPTERLLKGFIINQI